MNSIDKNSANHDMFGKVSVADGKLIFDRKHMETLWLAASWTGIGSCHELPFHHDLKYRIIT